MEKERIAELVRQAREGDGQAMNDLLQVAYPLAYKQCQAILRHPEDAEDMTQETLIQITRKLHTLEDPEKFVSWACRIAANQCLNERTRHPKDLQFAEDEEGHSVLDTLEDLDEQRIPDAAMDNAETSRMIAKLVDGLPEAQRVCTYLYYYDEMSVREIAGLLNVPENTVKSRLNYARKAIKEGVLGYEKDGVKLYSMSPLPFLLYFLRRSAEESCDPGAAAAAAAKALTAAGGGAASATASAGETQAVASGAAGTSGQAGSAVTKGTAGFLKSTAVKVVALVLTGSLAVGGITAAVRRPEDPELPGEPTTVEETQEPETTEYPGGIASFTMERTTNPGCDMIYLEAPVFEETTEGYRRLNEIFDGLREKFQTGDDHNIAYLLGHLDTPEVDGPLCYTEVYEVVSQDENTVTISVYQEHNFGELKSRGNYQGECTFDAQTGELTLAPENLQQIRESGMFSPEATDAEIIASVREEIAAGIRQWIDEMTAEYAGGWYEYGDNFFVFCRPELYFHAGDHGGHS